MTNWKPSEGLLRAEDAVVAIQDSADGSGLHDVRNPVLRHRMVEVIAAHIDAALTQQTIASPREMQSIAPSRPTSSGASDWTIAGQRAGLPSTPLTLNGGGAAQEPIVPPPAKAARKAKRGRGRPRGTTKAAKAAAAAKALEDAAKTS